jgi:hypothetical protein
MLITTERKLKILLTFISIGFITCIFLWITSQRNITIENRNLKAENEKQLNSMYFLYDELIKEKGESSRHELTREYFFTNHPNLKKEYEHYYEHETE